MLAPSQSLNKCAARGDEFPTPTTNQLSKLVEKKSSKTLPASPITPAQAKSHHNQLSENTKSSNSIRLYRNRLLLERASYAAKIKTTVSYNKATDEQSERGPVAGESTSLKSISQLRAEQQQKLARGSGKLAARPGEQHRQPDLQQQQRAHHLRPASVTNSRLRQGALIARRQYHMTQAAAQANQTTSLVIVGPTRASAATESASTTPAAGFSPLSANKLSHHHALSSLNLSANPPSRLAAITRQSNQLQARQSGGSANRKSSKFNLASSTSSLSSLAVVKRVKPSPQQIVSTSNRRFSDSSAAIMSAASSTTTAAATRPTGKSANYGQSRPATSHYPMRAGNSNASLKSGAVARASKPLMEPAQTTTTAAATATDTVEASTALVNKATDAFVDEENCEFNQIITNNHPETNANSRESSIIIDENERAADNSNIRLSEAGPNISKAAHPFSISDNPSTFFNNNKQSVAPLSEKGMNMISRTMDNGKASLAASKDPLKLHQSSNISPLLNENINNNNYIATNKELQIVQVSSALSTTANKSIQDHAENMPPTKRQQQVCTYDNNRKQTMDNKCERKQRQRDNGGLVGDILVEGDDNNSDAKPETGQLTSSGRKVMDFQEDDNHHHENITMRPQSLGSSESLQSALSSAISSDDQMILGSPLVTPPPSEIDCCLDDAIAISLSPSPQPPIQVDIPILSEPISDHYDLEARPFARGKFAQVKRCVNKLTKQCFAAKCIKKRRRSVDVKHEILLEIEALKLSYYTDRIIKLYQIFETPSEIVLILEMALGGELQRILDDEEKLNENVVRVMIKQILEGLLLLHDNDIAHLDIKPQNLLLTKVFEPHNVDNLDIKLCDFGISRKISKDCEIREICGTPDYVAPEILRYDPISLATDMWSLGVLTYVLLTGYSPFGSDNKQQTFCNITQATLDFPQDIFDSISNDAIDFMRKLMVQNPTKRLTSRQAIKHVWLTK